MDCCLIWSADAEIPLLARVILTTKTDDSGNSPLFQGTYLSSARINLTDYGEGNFFFKKKLSG